MRLFKNGSINHETALLTLKPNNNIFVKPLLSECEYKLLVFKLDIIASMFKIRKPKCLQNDVDGLNHKILLSSNDIYKLLTKKGVHLKKEGER